MSARISLSSTRHDLWSRDNVARPKTEASTSSRDIGARAGGAKQDWSPTVQAPR